MSGLHKSRFGYVLSCALHCLLILVLFYASSVNANGTQFAAVPNHPKVLWNESAQPQPMSHRPQDASHKVRTPIGERIVEPARMALSDQALGLGQSDAQLGSKRLTNINRTNLDMFKGEVRVLANKKIKRIAIGQGAVLRAEVLESGELLVIAESSGSSSLRIWFADQSQSDFNIRVSENDPETRIRMEKMVRMRVRMIEFRKSALTRLGIDWADSMNGPTFSAAGDVLSNSLYRPAAAGFENLPLAVDPVTAYFGVASNLTSKINAMAMEGDARILAEPVLSGTNGGVASFLAGGEVPYPTVGSNGESIVDFKEYGIRLEIQPSIDAGGYVRAGIKTEISQLDPAVTVQGAPGLLTRRANTTVNVISGQTIVISGLLSAEASNDITRVPGIGRLPVLGRLFRSDNIRNNVSELVIFITPEVIDPTQITFRERDSEFFSAASGWASDERSQPLPSQQQW